MSIQNWPEKINTSAVLVLVLALGLGFGRLWGIKANKPPVTIIEPTEKEAIVAPVESKVNQTAAVGVMAGKYVASKNSDKYHLPDCPGAKRIKEENKRWFGSKAEAEAAGLTPAANCPGI